MNEEEELKKALFQKKMEESAAEKENVEKTLKTIMSKMLEPKAKERLMNLKLVKPDIAMQLEMYLAQLYQTGQIKIITDKMMVEILKKMSAKKDFKITRK